MANQGIKALSTGLGVGLLAATLVSAVQAAPVNSWGDPGIYYRGGANPTYVVTVPSGSQSTDSVVIVELTLADITKNTWSINATVSGSIGAAAGAVVGINYAVNTDAIIGVTGTATTILSNGATTSYGMADTGTNGVPALNGVWNGVSKTWFVPGSASLSQTFAGISVIGSGTGAANCGYTYKVTQDTDGNFKVNTATGSINVVVTDGTLLDAQSSYNTAAWFPTVTKTSGLAAGDWTSYAVTAIGHRDAQTQGSFNDASALFKTVYKTSVASLGTASSSAATPFPNWPTSAAALVAKVNSCTPIYANRVALNNSGLIIGGSNGLSKIW